MQVLCLLWGISAIIAMLIAFIPLLGALNWLVIPFAGAGAIFSAIVLGTTRNTNRSMSLAGLICCGIAMVFGLIRLALGGGIL